MDRNDRGCDAYHHEQGTDFSFLWEVELIFFLDRQRSTCRQRHHSDSPQPWPRRKGWASRKHLLKDWTPLKARAMTIRSVNRVAISISAELGGKKERKKSRLGWAEISSPWKETGDSQWFQRRSVDQGIWD